MAPSMKIEGSRSERLSTMTKQLPKHKIPLPAELKRLGCDDRLWGKIRAKEAFVRLIEAGDDVGAKERLDQVRNAPSITGSDWPLPTILAEWGCDDELWSKIRAKRRLLQLANSGDEEEGRARIAKLKAAVAAEAVANASKEGAAKAKVPNRSHAKESGGGGAKPLSDGYSLDGEAPAGVDVASVEKLLADRVAAKLAREYGTADALQEQLEGMGVFCNDRQRTWSGERPR